MELNPDPRLARCGIAKLLGTRGDEVIEFFMQKYEILLGRNSKNSQVDVILVQFELVVLGKNGVTMDTEIVTPEKSPVCLKSGDRIRAGGCDFFFLLPSTTPALPCASAEMPQASSNPTMPGPQLALHSRPLSAAGMEPRDMGGPMSQRPLDALLNASASGLLQKGGSPSSHNRSPIRMDACSPVASQSILHGTPDAVKAANLANASPGVSGPGMIDAVAAYYGGAQGVEQQPGFAQIADAFNAQLQPRLQANLPPGNGRHVW